MHRSFHHPTVALALICACYTGPGIDPNASRGATTSTDPTVPSGEAGGDLPCDVAELLADACTSCHGQPLAGGAPNRLIRLADLAAPSKLDSSKTVADDCVARMKDKTNPMPPTARLASDRTAILEAWVAAGMPAGSCGAQSSTPTDTPTVCTSGRTWTRGNRGSQSMHPGVACIDCHSSSDEGPMYRVAGTVYPTAHEPDDCSGASGASIVITDANGKSYSLAVNSAGNFFSRERIAMPYTAKVVAGGKTREMVTSQRNGDCNVCHTEQGTEDAPGRIMMP